MFANRRSSQKPDESLYAEFKQRFSRVSPPTTSEGQGQGQGVPVTSQVGATSLDEAIVDPQDAHRCVPSPCLNLSPLPSVRHVQRATMSSPPTSPPPDVKSQSLTDDYFSGVFENADDTKDVGATPKTFTDPWRLTPSIMDPNSNLFSAFANQGPVYYTPTPGGFNTFYHSSAAGDLHTPGMGMNTPLSMPHSIHGLQAAEPSIHFTHFNPQLLHPQQMYPDPYQIQQPPPPLPPPQQHLQPGQQTFAPPSHFVHQDSGYAALDESSNKTTPNQNDVAGLQGGLSAPPIQQHDSGVSIPTFPGNEKFIKPSQSLSGPPEADRFRYHTTLNAPTAMVRSADEIPVTYLNKGQAYTMSIYDTLPPGNAAGLRYRTYVRISFEDEQQRAKTGACWQLWREGRGSNEAHQRGGKLLAVEFVDPNQGGDDELRRPQVELEKASFDGFVVNWHPSNRANGVADCSISVRFNFLSTDFSHSKGVKGIPVRLCAKTQLLTSLPNASSNEAEVCFAKVKLFRDHGAERKLSNDIAHVKKSIEKLKQQISQAEAGVGTVGKRKRSGSMAKGAASRSKLTKHKRSWSADSDAEMGRVSAEEDLHAKLLSLQDMFSSTRPMSVLYLRGDPEDDPDLFPVKIAGGDEPKTLDRSETWESKVSGSESPRTNAESPSASSISITPKRKYSELQQSAILEEEEDEDERREELTHKKAKFDRSASPERATKTIKRETESTKDNIYALDVDSSYKPPPERPIKPGKLCRRAFCSGTDMKAVACFYVKEMGSTKPYFRAVYLVRRTVKDLINGIAEKFGIDPKRVTQVTHINAKGLRIIVDEDVVREVPEGQDMIVEFAPVVTEHPTTHQQELEKTTLADGDLLINATISDPLEMWLNY